MQEVSRVTPGGDFSSGHTKKPWKPSLGLSSLSPPWLGHCLLALSCSGTGRRGGVAPFRSCLPRGSPSFASHANAVGMSRVSGMGPTLKNPVELVKYTCSVLGNV